MVAALVFHGAFAFIARRSLKRARARAQLALALRK